MKIIRNALLALIIMLNTIFVSGCWNYREVDKMAVVTGIAVDKEKSGLYKVTVEILKVTGEKDVKTSSEIIAMEGKTIFDAVRNGISLSGKRLYWSHAKVLIISKQIASEGVSEILDWYNRDSETRPDVIILISKENTAEEIFSAKGVTEEIKSFVIDDMVKNQKSASKAPKIDILKFDNDLKSEGISAIAPTVTLKQTGGKLLPHIMGTAIFKLDKVVGYLDGEETKDLLFIRNMVKAGVLTEEIQENDITTKVTLEIFSNRTQVKPVINDKDIKININVDTQAAIDEIGGNESFANNERVLSLEKTAEKNLKKRIESLIKKIQAEYDVDIFGFGAKLRENKYVLWKDLRGNWEDKFKNLEVNVTTKVHIRNSAVLSDPVEERD